MPYYRKKPVVIEARKFDAVTIRDGEDLAAWCGGRLRGTRLAADDRIIQIDTREGEMEAKWGDWIIKGVKGEFYPCKPDIFEVTYDFHSYI